MPDSPDTNHVRPVASPLLRGLLLSLGTAALVVGVIGIAVPLLPTTPFLLLTAACYARASARLYHWLMNHRWFGPTLRAWRDHRAIPRRVKPRAMLLIVVTFTASALLVPLLHVRVLLALLGVGVLLFLWRLPVRPDSDMSQPELRAP